MNNQRLADIKAKKGYHILPVKPGMQLELHETVGEGNNKRTRKFKGLVLSVKKPNHADGTFLIRGKAAGMTIEKIYPLSFGKFEKVLLVDSYKIRRAKLYYLRDKVGKGAKMNSNSTAEDRGVDLLTLAKEEAEKLLASVAPAAAEAVDEKLEEASEKSVEEVKEVDSETSSEGQEAKAEPKAEEKQEETKEEKQEQAKEEKQEQAEEKQEQAEEEQEQAEEK